VSEVEVSNIVHSKVKLPFGLCELDMGGAYHPRIVDQIIQRINSLGFEGAYKLPDALQVT
jgi:hypothetical protein